jgi:hypothetical protein
MTEKTKTAKNNINANRWRYLGLIVLSIVGTGWLLLIWILPPRVPVASNPWGATSVVLSPSLNYGVINPLVLGLICAGITWMVLPSLFGFLGDTSESEESEKKDKYCPQCGRKLDP